MLANIMEYGSSYLSLAPEHELTLAASRKILAYYQHLLSVNEQSQEELDHLHQVKEQLSQ
jgi:hypothetical protein